MHAIGVGLEQLEFEQPANRNVAAWEVLGQAREPDCAVRDVRAKLGHLTREPLFQLVGCHRHTRMAADG